RRSASRPPAPAPRPRHRQSPRAAPAPAQAARTRQKPGTTDNDASSALATNRLLFSSMIYFRKSVPTLRDHALRRIQPRHRTDRRAGAAFDLDRKADELEAAL